jgi:hypothetical protein
MRPFTAGSCVPRPPGHLADRDLGLIRRHASLLLGEGGTSFRYGRKAGGTGGGPEPAT